MFTWSIADLRESDLFLVPLQALDGVSLPPQVGLQLGTKLIWHTTTWPLHGPDRHKGNFAHNKVKFSINLFDLGFISTVCINKQFEVSHSMVLGSKDPVTVRP